MLQTFPRQQMTFNDMQLLKKQVMFKQMQEYQLQQQQQQLQKQQLDSLNSNAVGSHPLISGTPLQDASSVCWQPDLMTGNTNWANRGISPVVQGSSTGLAQQFQPSLYGMPVGGANAPENAFSFVQMNRLTAQHGSANMSSSLTNQPNLFLNQSDLQGSHMLPRSTSPEKLLFSHTSVPESNTKNDFESFKQDNSHERNISVPENINAVQRSTALDPTEEKILFGSDDNLWDAFGNSNDMGSSDLFPSLQSGSWSALMLSAVAETSSDGSGVHDLGCKQQSAWVNNNTGPPVGGNKVSDCGLLEKPMARHSQMAGNMFHSSSSGINDRLGIWKAASQDLVDPMQMASYGAGTNSRTHRDDQGIDNSVEKAIPQQSFRDSTQILESYRGMNASNVMAESSEPRNSSNTLRSKFLPESLSYGFRETTQVNVPDVSMLPCRKETQSPSRSESLVRDGIDQKESIHQMLHFNQTVPRSFVNKEHATSACMDPQMAPFQYSQNGPMQPVNDTGSFTPSEIEEQYPKVENLVDGLHSVKPSDPSFSVHMQPMSDSTSLPQGSTNKLLKADKPKKRKTETSELLSWNRGIMQGPHRLKNLGEAEVDWARASNRFSEKVGFETSPQDGPLIRSKRRLVYATELMQQLFSPPPPAKVKSLVASYEWILYTAARVALGDACSSSTSTDRSERISPPNNSKPLSERTETEKISDQYISKAAEDFISRTKKLETDFARLETGVTISDLSVEVQDLERFGVINRFASFHQSSSDRAASSHKLNPQRYVTIAPMPRNIPDRVQCLSF